MKSLDFPHTTIVTGGAAVLLNDINKYLKGGMLAARRRSPSRS